MMMINSVLTSVSRIVAGMRKITASLCTLCRRCWLPGRRRGTECWWLCAAAARCGEMTPVRDLGQVYQVIPGYTRLYQHSRNTFQLMNITRCSLYSPGSASSRHQQPPRNEPAAAADAHPSCKLRNFSALLCICSLQRCLIESFPPRPRLFIYWSV